MQHLKWLPEKFNIVRPLVWRSIDRTNIDWIVVTGVYLSPDCFKIIHLEIWTVGYL